MFNLETRPRTTVASHDLERRRKLERAGYVIESGTPQEFVMRRDFPNGLLSGIDELAQQLSN